MASPGGASSGLPPDTSRGPGMLRAIWIMDALAAVIVGLRLVASGVVIRKITIPDYLMVAALLFGIANNACLTVSENYGLGLAEPLGILSPTLGRLSFTLYLLKLVGPDRRKRYTLHFCIWFNLIINILCIILIFAQCGLHVTAIWDTHAPGASSCWSRSVQANYGYFQGACNALLDLVLTILPAWLVWNLKLARRVKIGLMVLLGLSFFACVASIVKTVEISVFTNGDFTYAFVPFAVWFTVENNIVITAASIPAIKPLFGRKKAGTGYGSYGMNSYGKTPSDMRHPQKQGYFNHNQSEVTSTGDGFGTGDGIIKETTVMQRVLAGDDDSHHIDRTSPGADSERGFAQAV